MPFDVIKLLDIGSGICTYGKIKDFPPNRSLPGQTRYHRAGARNDLSLPCLFVLPGCSDIDYPQKGRAAAHPTEKEQTFSFTRRDLGHWVVPFQGTAMASVFVSDPPHPLPFHLMNSLL